MASRPVPNIELRYGNPDPYAPIPRAYYGPETGYFDVPPHQEVGLDPQSYAAQMRPPQILGAAPRPPDPTYALNLKAATAARYQSPQGYIQDPNIASDYSMYQSLDPTLGPRDLNEGIQHDQLFPHGTPPRARTSDDQDRGLAKRQAARKTGNK